jgi:hypothetical protein
MATVVLVAMLGTLSACSSPALQNTDPPPTSSASTGPITAPSVDPIVSVVDPWRKGDFQKGIQIYWSSDSEYTQVDATRILDYVVSLGANSVGISFPVYVDGASPTKTYAGEKTPSVKDLRLVIQEARARDLRVMLRPVIDEQNITGEITLAWRGTIGYYQPFSPSGWFASYRAFLAPYLRLAEQQGVDEFVLGSELTDLQSATEWQQVRAEARQLYKGELSYALNWTWQPKPAGFNNLGIDMYTPLPLGDDASVAQLASGLTTWLKHQQALIGQKLTVHEIGIQAQDTAYQHPWGWTTDDTRVNLTIQKRWFAAAYLACKRAGALGAYYWSVNSTQQLGKDLDVAAQPPGNFMGRPGEAAIRHAFK